MSVLHAVLLFGGVPLLVIVVVTLLVMAPSMKKGPRYRPGQPWDADQIWFGGPVEGSPDAIIEARTEHAGSLAVGPGRDEAPPAGVGHIGAQTGGASVRW